MNVTKTKRPNAEVSLSGVLHSADIEQYWGRALKAVIESVALPGFRKGHAPEERVLQEFGERGVWREAAEMALRDSLEELFKKEEIMPIAPLSLSLKPAEKGSDVEFEILAVVAPSVTLGDYKAIAKGALDKLPTEDTAGQEEEAKKAFRLQARALSKMSKPANTEEENKNEDESAPLTDEDVKPLGFESAAAFEEFVASEAKSAVAGRAEQKRRAVVAEALISASQSDIPRLYIREEAEALLDATKRDIASQNMEWSGYLKHTKKTEGQIITELETPAEKRIALDLIFAEIVKKEDLKLEGEEAKKAEDELAHRLVHQGVDHDRAHLHARESLLREKVWEILGVKAT